ncbi:hypothetical protein NE237_006460 [Protea cynaroides]|uniref:Alcohol dehydrogenase-like C-terminal domain-containing protein n=1 Tax=Protea cynaroides TaxID=273540 RepID=A0A9Q0KMJ4_9MAGN|nr:hypothetical protein NE237_006460 [Protea cynaroides]
MFVTSVVAMEVSMSMVVVVVVFPIGGLVMGFVVKIPVGMVSEQAGTLLCARLTVYGPLRHFGYNQSGVRGAILGLGGVGHMVAKIAKAMGHHVTVISSSDKKREEAINHIGTDAYLVSSYTEGMKAAADSLDYITDTIPVFHLLEPYLNLLKIDEKLILTSVISTPLKFILSIVMLG